MATSLASGTVTMWGCCRCLCGRQGTSSARSSPARPLRHRQRQRRSTCAYSQQSLGGAVGGVRRSSMKRRARDGEQAQPRHPLERACLGHCPSLPRWRRWPRRSPSTASSWRRTWGRRAPDLRSSARLSSTCKSTPFVTHRVPLHRLVQLPLVEEAQLIRPSPARQQTKKGLP